VFKSKKPSTADVSLDTLYRRHFDDLCLQIRSSYGAGPPEPEDAVQTAFAKFAKLENPNRIKNARSFLFIMARNVILDFKRSKKTSEAYIEEQIALDRDLQLERITPERVIYSKQRFDTLIKAMQSLPSKQQKILYMSRIEGKSYKQISAETGWSAGDISRNMSAGISILVASLERIEKRKRNPKLASITDSGDQR